jgi:hypothetical protein
VGKLPPPVQADPLYSSVALEKEGEEIYPPKPNPAV